MPLLHRLCPSTIDRLKAEGNVEGLIEALGCRQDRSVRRAATKALGDIGDIRAVEPLIAALEDEDQFTRWNAAEALGRIGDARAVEPLIAALKDKDLSTRRSAADALGRIGDAHAVEPLIAALKDKDPSTRRSAADALGRIGDARAVDPLIAALKDRDIVLRQYAAKAIVRIGGLGTLESLVATLKDKDPAVRQYAAEILGRIGDVRAVEPLIAALEEEDKAMGRTAIEALVKIGDPRAVDLESKYKEMASMSRDYCVLCSVVHDNSTTTGYIDFEHEYQLDSKGFANVFRAIEDILDEIRLNAEKTDPYSRYQIRRLIDILRDLTRLEVKVGTHVYFYDQNPYYEEEHDGRYDCAEPIRARAREALQEVTDLVQSGWRE